MRRVPIGGSCFLFEKNSTGSGAVSGEDPLPTLVPRGACFYTAVFPRLSLSQSQEEQASSTGENGWLDLPHARFWPMSMSLSVPQTHSCGTFDIARTGHEIDNLMLLLE